jgi:hypothetical protein
VVILVIRVLVIAALCRVVILGIVVAVLVVVTAHVLHSAVVFFTKSKKVYLKKLNNNLSNRFAYKFDLDPGSESFTNEYSMQEYASWPPDPEPELQSSKLTVL